MEKEKANYSFIATRFVAAFSMSVILTKLFGADGHMIPFTMVINFIGVWGILAAYPKYRRSVWVLVNSVVAIIATFSIVAKTPTPSWNFYIGVTLALANAIAVIVQVIVRERKGQGYIT